jgi:4a-hydroxytetrahydrobiopterin dehydratase
MSLLADRKCHPVVKGTPPVDHRQLEAHSEQLPGWSAAADGKAMQKTFRFTNFYETMSFVNAVAHIANTQDHHPDLSVSYNSCRVHYSTHTIGGISENDLICAAKIERL